MERGAEKGGPARRRETADLEVAPIRRLFQEQNDSPAPSGGLACTRPSQEEGGRSWGSEAPVADCRRLFLGPGARGPTPSCARVAPPGMRRRGRWRRGAIWKAPPVALRLSKGRLLRAGGGCSAGSMRSRLAGSTARLTSEGTVCLLMRCESKSPVAWGAVPGAGKTSQLLAASWRAGFGMKGHGEGREGGPRRPEGLGPTGVGAAFPEVAGCRRGSRWG